MKNIIGLVCLILFASLLVACSPLGSAGNEISAPTETAQDTAVPIATATPTSAPTPTITPTPRVLEQSEYGDLIYTQQERYFYSDNANPGVITITDRDLSNPVVIGVDLPGYKFIESVSPDGKWLIFFSNSKQTVEAFEPCDPNNLYVASADGSTITNLQLSTCIGQNSLVQSVTHWNPTSTKHLLKCTSEGSDGLCAIVLENEQIVGSVVDPHSPISMTTSPDKEKLIYSFFLFSRESANCISVVDYETLQANKIHCRPANDDNFQGLQWLSDSTRFVAALVLNFNQDGLIKNQMLLFDINTSFANDLFLYTGWIPKVATSSDDNQIVMCSPSFFTVDPPQLLFYSYDMTTQELKVIDHTSELVTEDNPLSPFSTCIKGSFAWDESGSVHFSTISETDESHSYLLDFEQNLITSIE